MLAVSLSSWSLDATELSNNWLHEVPWYYLAPLTCDWSCKARNALYTFSRKPTFGITSWTRHHILDQASHPGPGPEANTIKISIARPDQSLWEGSGRTRLLKMASPSISCSIQMHACVLSYNYDYVPAEFTLAQNYHLAVAVKVKNHACTNCYCVCLLACLIKGGHT